MPVLELREDSSEVGWKNTKIEGGHTMGMSGDVIAKL